MVKFVICVLCCLLPLAVIAKKHPSNPGEWGEFYQKSLNGKEPRPTLSLAVQNFEKENRAPGYAVDLGTGVGVDALFLLKKKWHVLAIDAEPSSIEILLSRVPKDQLDHLEAKVISFCDMALPDNVDLINASYCLPFCRPSEFPKCWQYLIDHLAVGGRFAGQLYGDKDVYASYPNCTTHTKEQMLQLFEKNFEIEYLQVEESWHSTETDTPELWHLYHIVAKKVR